MARWWHAPRPPSTGDQALARPGGNDVQRRARARRPRREPFVALGKLEVDERSFLIVRGFAQRALGGGTRGEVSDVVGVNHGPLLEEAKSRHVPALPSPS